MNRNEIKQLMPVLNAFAEGKPIEYKHSDGKWETWTDFEFNASPDNYRIKPELKRREWRPEEVPVGALVCYKEQTEFPRVILSVGLKQFSFVWNGEGKAEIIGINFDEALCKMLHSTTGRNGPWQPCGVLEEPK